MHLDEPWSRHDWTCGCMSVNDGVDFVYTGMSHKTNHKPLEKKKNIKTQENQRVGFIYLISSHRSTLWPAEEVKVGKKKVSHYFF